MNMRRQVLWALTGAALVAGCITRTVYVYQNKDGTTYESSNAPIYKVSDLRATASDPFEFQGTWNGPPIDHATRGVQVELNLGTADSKRLGSIYFSSHELIANTPQQLRFE